MAERGLRLFACAALLAAAGRAHAQDVGHRVLGTIGLDAGSQAPQGIVAADRLLLYSSSQLVDRQGRRVPVSVHIGAAVTALGVAATVPLPRLGGFVSAGLAVPLGGATGQSSIPDANRSRFGVGDIFVQPLKLGWRRPQFDVVAGYAFYVPTRAYEADSPSGISQSQWSHELSVGGTVAESYLRSWQLSALASYQLNQRKEGVDITRGNSVQIQGGAGHALSVLQFGLVGYALWQVTDDRGQQLPAARVGARDVAYGLGAELDVNVPAARCRLTLRYAQDIAAESRPLGHTMVIGFTTLVWRHGPRTQATPPALTVP
jgi:hypothetical protein